MTLQGYVFVCVLRTFKVSPTKFQVYHTVFAVSMLHIDPQNLWYLSVYTLRLTSSHFPHCSALGNLHHTLHFCAFDFFF
jgi:hypothetical protein